MLWGGGRGVCAWRPLQCVLLWPCTRTALSFRPFTPRGKRNQPTDRPTNQPTTSQVGGTPAILKYLHSRGYINGDCMTVTTETMAQNLAKVPELKAGQVRRGVGVD